MKEMVMAYERSYKTVLFPPTVVDVDGDGLQWEFRTCLMFPVGNDVNSSRCKQEAMKLVNLAFAAF